MVADSVLKKIQTLLNRGYRWEDIGHELGVAPSTAHRWYNTAENPSFSSKSDGQKTPVDRLRSVKRIKQLLDKNHRWEDIGHDLGVAPSTAYRWYHEKDETHLHSETAEVVKIKSNASAIIADNKYTFSLNAGEEILKQKASHVYTELKEIISQINSYQRSGSATPVENIKNQFKIKKWKMEWPLSETMDIRADAYKDRVVVELEFSNREILHRDLNRFKQAVVNNKVDVAVLFTFADLSAVLRWGKNEKQARSYLTLDWIRHALDEYRLAFEDVPIWFIGIR